MIDRAYIDTGSGQRGAGPKGRRENGRSCLVRQLRHSLDKVWQALTDLVQPLREWAPFEADGSLGSVGTNEGTFVGAPTRHVTETTVTRADAPKMLKPQLGRLRYAVGT